MSVAAIGARSITSSSAKEYPLSGIDDIDEIIWRNYKTDPQPPEGSALIRQMRVTVPKDLRKRLEERRGNDYVIPDLFVYCAWRIARQQEDAPAMLEIEHTRPEVFEKVKLFKEREI